MKSKLSEQDFLKMSVADKGKIYRRASRNVGSETVLILTAGFAMFMVIFFVFGTQTFLPIAAVFDANPTSIWLLLSIMVAGVWAVIHKFRATKKVADARSLQFEIYRFEGQRKQAETNAKIEEAKSLKKL